MADLTAALARSAILSGNPGQTDAALALLGKAAEAIDDATEAETRELFGFVNGFAYGLALCGEGAGSVLLGQMGFGSGEHNSAAMREALRGVLTGAAG
jgi:hypothetical protein